MKLSAITIATGIALGLAVSTVEAGPIEREKVYSHTVYDSGYKKFNLSDGSSVLAGFYAIDNGRTPSTWAKLHVQPLDGSQSARSYDFVSRVREGYHLAGEDWWMNITDVQGVLLPGLTAPVTVEWHLQKRDGNNFIRTELQTSVITPKHVYRWVAVSAPSNAALLGLGLVALWRARRGE